ncbi:MAG: hypothetical protein WB870_09520 [Gallionellaceae bacterium]
MTRLIEMSQYDTLTALRRKVTEAVHAGDAAETHRTIGMVQGYLIGLHAAGEIDARDVHSLEAETLGSVHFLLNARNGANAH